MPALNPCCPRPPPPPAADCTAALLGTALLEGSRFDPTLVTWLLDRGAVVAPPLASSTPGSSTNSSSDSSSDSSSSGSSGGSVSQRPPSAAALLLARLGRELHVARQLSKLQAGTGRRCDVPWLLRRAADCLQRLLAAGAPPVGGPDPTGALADAVAALQPGDWAAVEAAASRPPRWSPQQHHRFPRPWRRRAREVLLVAHRGWTIPTSEQPGDATPRQEQARQTVWLPPLIVHNIVRHMAPCSQL